MRMIMRLPSALAARVIVSSVTETFRGSSRRSSCDRLQLTQSGPTLEQNARASPKPRSLRHRLLLGRFRIATCQGRRGRFCGRKGQGLISFRHPDLILLKLSTLTVRGRVWGLIQKDKNFAVADSRYVTPTPVPRLSPGTGLTGRPRQVEKPSLTRLEIVR